MNKAVKNKNVALLTISTIIIVLVIIIVGVAYAKYVVQKNGTISASVAKVICNMNVVPCSENDNTIVNPYCTVTLNDFNNPQDVTQADITFKVEVDLDANSALETMPTYYWLDSNGNRVNGVNESEPLTGTFTKGNAETKQYTVEFVNLGENATTADVIFNLTAVQNDD